MNKNEAKTEITYEYFERFVDFFNPKDALNKIFLKAFICAPIFSREYTFQKPSCQIWIINGGPGVGKTSLAEFIGKLYYDGVIRLNKHDFKNEKNIIKRLLPDDKYLKTIALIDDNLDTFDYDKLLSLTKPPYFSEKIQHTTKARANDIIYVVTGNGMANNNPLTYFVDLIHPEYNYAWRQQVADYISNHRLDILKDIIEFLNYKNQKNFWHEEAFNSFVLRAHCSDDAEYETVLALLDAKRTRT